MRAKLIAFIIIVITVIIQTTIKDIVIFTYGAPDLIFVLTLYFAIRYGSMSGQLIGFMLGFYVDLTSTNVIGVHMLFYTIFGFVIGFLKNELFIDNFFSTFLFIVFAIIIKGLVYYLLIYIISGSTVLPIPQYLLGLLVQILFSAIIGSLVIFKVLDKFTIVEEKRYDY